MRAKGITDRQLSEIAWLYYIEDLTQGEIARKFSVSRPTILSYLKLAKDRGLFEIRLRPEHFRVHELSVKLKSRFMLAEAYVVDEPNLSGKELQEAVCAAAGHIFADGLAPGDQVGVSCGHTISLVSRLMPFRTVENVVVRQLLGSVASPVAESAEACTLEVARKISGQCVTLNAPAVCSSARLTSALKREPMIAQQLAELRQCNKAVLSLSPCDLTMPSYTLGITTKDVIDAYAAGGAAGSVVMHFMDGAGRPMPGVLDDRLIGIDLADLAAIGDTFVVVCGVEKVRACLAAIRGGYVRRLVIDRPSAESLLIADEGDQSARTTRPARIARSRGRPARTGS